MKVGSRCGYCLLHRGYQEILRSTDDEGMRFRAVEGLLGLLGNEFNRGSVPAHLGSDRDRIIKNITGCRDPYIEMKKRANAEALLLLPKLEALVEAQPSVERFRTACLISCVGNVIEYDVPGHSHDIDEALEGVWGEGFFIDDTEGFRALVNQGTNLMFLTDNAGEIVFDRLLVRELRALGCRVTVAVKGGPALNDALVEDALTSGISNDADEVIDTGTDAIGIDLGESSEDFRNRFNGAELILSKGMANWETLTEMPAPCPVLFLFRAKCEPVARVVGAPLERNVAKLVPRGWRL